MQHPRLLYMCTIKSILRTFFAIIGMDLFLQYSAFSLKIEGFYIMLSFNVIFLAWTVCICSITQYHM